MTNISLTYKTEFLIVQPCKSNLLSVISNELSRSKLRGIQRRQGPKQASGNMAPRDSIIIINLYFFAIETMKDPVIKNILIIGSMQ
jgi:hypothetical protein